MPSIKKYPHHSIWDFQHQHDLGDSLNNIAVLKAEIVVSLIQSEKLVHFVRGVENFFTWGHSDKTFESWFSHFALRLTIRVADKKERLLVLEKTHCGVSLSDRLLEDEEIVVETFPVDDLSLQAVIDFAKEQQGKPYNALVRNCKNFVYQFYRAFLVGEDYSYFFKFRVRLERKWRELDNAATSTSTNG